MKPSQYSKQHRSYLQSNPISQRKRERASLKMSPLRKSIEHMEINTSNTHTIQTIKRSERSASKMHERSGVRSQLEEASKSKRKHFQLPQINKNSKGYFHKRSKNSQRMIKALKKDHQMLFDSLHGLLAKRQNNEKYMKTITQFDIDCNKRRIREMSLKYKLDPTEYENSFEDRKCKKIFVNKTLSQWQKLALCSKTIATEPTNFDTEINHISELYEKSNSTLEMSFENKKRLIQLSMILNQKKATKNI